MDGVGWCGVETSWHAGCTQCLLRPNPQTPRMPCTQDKHALPPTKCTHIHVHQPPSARPHLSQVSHPGQAPSVMAAYQG